MAAKKQAAARKAPKKASAAKPSRKKSVKAIPDGYRALTPYLAIAGAGEAVDFYKKVFGARVRMRMDGPEGKIGHAELVIGDSVLMLADEFAEMEFLGPKSRGGTSVSLHLYVKDCDKTIALAAANGARIARPAKDQFYGDRSGTFLDPFGHMWNIATHKEDLTPAEMRKRAEAAMKRGNG